MPYTLQVLVLVGAVATSMCGVRKLADRQIRTTQQACACTCSVVDEATLPGFWDLSFPGVLHDGERTHGAWGGGTLICLRPEEPNVAARMREIQSALIDVECARGWRDVVACARMGR